MAQADATVRDRECGLEAAVPGFHGVRCIRWPNSRGGDEGRNVRAVQKHEQRDDVARNPGADGQLLGLQRHESAAGTREGNLVRCVSS